MLRSFLAPGPRRSRDRPRAAAAGARSSGTRDLGAYQVGHRRQPVLRARGARATSTWCSATCGGCRSRDGAFTEGVRARRVRAPVARGARATCCARRRACSRPAAGCSSTATCGRTRGSRGGLQADQPAGALARAARPGRPGAGAAAQVGSPEPARGHPRPRAHGRPRPASASRASATTRRSSAASSRTSSCASASTGWRGAPRRAARPPQAAAAIGRATTPRARRARPAQGAASARRGPAYAALRRADVADEARHPAVRPRPVGAVLRAARTRTRGSGRP